MPNVSWLPTLTILSINSWRTCTYFVYFKSKKELNYDRFVDLNILGAARLAHSDLRIYRISLFLLDIIFFIQHAMCGAARLAHSDLRIYRISLFLLDIIFFIQHAMGQNTTLMQCLQISNTCKIDFFNMEHLLEITYPELFCSSIAMYNGIYS